MRLVQTYRMMVVKVGIALRLEVNDNEAAFQENNDRARIGWILWGPRTRVDEYEVDDLVFHFNDRL